MARVTEKGISGGIANLVFYTMDGKSYVRSKPGPRKKARNKVPNPLNTIFGTVSKYGSAMAKSLNGQLLFPLKRSAYNRLRGWMRNLYALHQQEASWELSTKTGGMCQLAEGIDFRDFFREEIIVTDMGKGKVKIELPIFTPSAHVQAPPRTKKVNLKIFVVSSAFKGEPAAASIVTDQLTFNYSNKKEPAKTIILQTPGKQKDIVMLALALEYEIFDGTSNTLNRELRWLPAAVAGIGRLKP